MNETESSKDQLKAFLDQQLSEGMSLETLRPALHDNGWKDEDIDAAAEASTHDAAHRKVLVVVVGIATLVILLIIGFMYVAVNGLPQMWSTSDKAPETSQTTEEEAAAPEATLNADDPVVPEETDTNEAGPAEAYLEMRREYQSLRTYDEMVAHIHTYGTKDTIKTLNEASQNLTEEEKTELAKVIEEEQKIPPDSMVVTVVENDGGTATLSVVSEETGMIGTITLVNEDGVWKLQDQVWDQIESTVPSETGSNPEIVEPTESLETPASPREDTSTTTTEPVAGETPEEAYLRMRKDADVMASLDDLIAYVRNHGTEARVAEMEETLPDMRESNPETLLFLVLMAKNPPSEKIVVASTVIHEDVATLTMRTTDDTMTGTITLKKENGLWKVELESWKNS